MKSKRPGKERRGRGSSSCIPACLCVKSPQFVLLCTILWTVAPQTPLPMGFSRQKSWSALPYPPPGGLLSLCLLGLLHWQVGSLPLGPPGKPPVYLADSKLPSSTNGQFLLNDWDSVETQARAPP